MQTKVIPQYRHHCFQIFLPNFHIQSISDPIWRENSSVCSRSALARESPVPRSRKPIRIEESKGTPLGITGAIDAQVGRGCVAELYEEVDHRIWNQMDFGDFWSKFEWQWREYLVSSWLGSLVTDFSIGNGNKFGWCNSIYTNHKNLKIALWKFFWQETVVLLYCS